MSFFIESYNNSGWKGSQGHVVQPPALQKSSLQFFLRRTLRLRLEFIVVSCSNSTVVFHPWQNRLSTQNPKKSSALSQFETCPILQSVKTKQNKPNKKNPQLNQDVYVEASFRYFQIKGIFLRLLRWLMYLHWGLQLSFLVFTSLISFFWYTFNKYYMHYSRIQVSGSPCKENK